MGRERQPLLEAASQELEDLFKKATTIISQIPVRRRRASHCGKIGAPPTFPHFFLTLSYKITYMHIRLGEPRPRRIFVPKIASRKSAHVGPGDLSNLLLL